MRNHVDRFAFFGQRLDVLDCVLASLFVKMDLFHNIKYLYSAFAIAFVDQFRKHIKLIFISENNLIERFAR